VPVKPVTLIAVAFLALVALAHVLRILLHVAVVAGGVTVPMWLSGPAALFTGALAVLLWRERRR
jgi:hypothetical protein